MTVPNSYAKEVANAIRQQLGVPGFMTLGASDLYYTVESDMPGLAFKARILPFLKNGKRGSRPRVMDVRILLNAMDTYDVRVGYLNGVYWVSHYVAKDVYADQLQRLALALDYNGPEVLNPRYL